MRDNFSVLRLCTKLEQRCKLNCIGEHATISDVLIIENEHFYSVESFVAGGIKFLLVVWNCKDCFISCSSNDSMRSRWLPL